MKYDDQNVWNAVFGVFFIALIGIGAYILSIRPDGIPTSITLFDALLVALASFRATRLFVYDKITKFIRDWFLNKKVLQGEGVEIVIVRQIPIKGPRRTAYELLTCPWCFGIWAGFSVAFFYFLSPYTWFFIFALAISGVATLLQLTANMIGWRSEHLKQKTENKS